MTNTVANQPAAVSLQSTDLLLAWQSAQAPPTRSLPISGLAAYYLLLSTGGTITGPVTLSSSGAGINLTLTGAAGNARQLVFQTAAATRWSEGADGSTESGSNSGSNYNLSRYADNGTLIDVPLGIDRATGTVQFKGAAAGPLYNFLGGLTLSNDASTPNSVLDIAAGACADSTNAYAIKLTAFTKTTGGAWVAGTGNAGMGTGLTVADSTWYHVFAIINAGVPDVYFDTSVTAANAPSGTTAYRRIGSIATDPSAHIVAFVQNGDRFDWKTTTNNSITPSDTNAHLAIVATPLGVIAEAILCGNMVGGSGGQADLTIWSPALSNASEAIAAIVNSSNAAFFTQVETNTASEVNYQVSALPSGIGLNINTLGWRDTRGK